MSDEALDLISTAEAARLLGISIWQMQQLCRQRRIAHFRYTPRTVLMERSVVLAFRENALRAAEANHG